MLHLYFLFWQLLIPMILSEWEKRLGFPSSHLFLSHLLSVVHLLSHCQGWLLLQSVPLHYLSLTCFNCKVCRVWVFFFFSWTALLKCNLHTIKFSPFKCTIQWFSEFTEFCSHHHSFRAFLSPPKYPLCLFVITSCSHVQSQATTNLSVCLFRTFHMNPSYDMWSFVSGAFT